MFQITPDNAEKAVKATIILHNIMHTRYSNIQNAEMEAPQGAPGSWRRAGVLPDVEAEGGGRRALRANREGKELRCYLRHYYNSEAGAVHWQEQLIALPEPENANNDNN